MKRYSVTLEYATKVQRVPVLVNARSDQYAREDPIVYVHDVQEQT